MNKTVLLIRPTIRSTGINYLEDKCKVVYAPNGEEDTLIDYINTYNISAVITRTERITEKVIKSTSSLKFIGQHGVGLDNIDLDACKVHGVAVLNVPDANFMSVAEHAMTMILALSKNLMVNDEEVRKNNWAYREQYFPSEINNKNMYVIGFGRNGRETARKAMDGFGMHVLGFDPFVSKKEMELINVNKMNKLEDGLAQADFVSIHVPLTPGTKHLISSEQLSVMKSSAYIINVSRGQILDNKALYHALTNNIIAGAGLDVLENEPPEMNDPILNSKKIIFTPHIAGDTKEAKDRTSLTIAREIVLSLKGEVSNNVVNY